MAFKQVIDFCVVKNSNDIYELIVTDITGLYNSVTNPTGWNNASSLLVNDITEATITITYTDSSNNVITTTTDILDQIPNPATAEFEFDPFLFNGDGLYLVKSIIKTSSTTYETCVQKVIYPEVSCCIAKKLSKLSIDLDNEKLYEKVVKLKTFEKVLYTASQTVDSLTAMKVLNKMEKLCAEKCDCGC